MQQPAYASNGCKCVRRSIPARTDSQYIGKPETVWKQKPQLHEWTKMWRESAQECATQNSGCKKMRDPSPLHSNRPNEAGGASHAQTGFASRLPAAPSPVLAFEPLDGTGNRLLQNRVWDAPSGSFCSHANRRAFPPVRCGIPTIPSPLVGSYLRDSSSISRAICSMRRTRW